MRKTFDALVPLLTLVGALLGLIPSHAVTSNLHVSPSTRLGDCPQGGNVELIEGSGPYAGPNASGQGDDLVYPPSSLRPADTLIAYVRCDRPARLGGSYWEIMTLTSYPARDGQAASTDSGGVR
ncbi:hypothetical protein I6A60_39135 [Frankia sp. AgB1.9]|uniref:hypothetical protein n=1 Tax=unclassified Frankia TaxID=2632575 RepID=UPI0019315AA5|nr:MULTISPECIES: hypothetical protein [unclassified Frankia]MBL7491559.1 hypothetical protein [Frankia sp. AgW1.1]MBL7553800.1 hypothetical protein [Frankia sp. AgB1.9]MBL7617900.1 hypothetical protein [Frankia sp. AgB1.8]